MPAPDYVPRQYNCVATVTPAATPTDLVYLLAAITPIKVRRIRIYAGQTGAAAYTFHVIKRLAANGGGTLTNTLGVPLDSNMSAGVSFFTYTANAVTLGTAAGTLLITPTTIPAIANGQQLVLDFDVRDRPVILRATEGISVNGNGVSFGAGIAMTATIEWDEGGL